MEKVESLGRRLQQLMEERSLNYDRLGRLLDMKPQTLNRYVLGQREPKARVATEMAMRLEVDPLWLQGYNVPQRTASEEQAKGQMVPVLEEFQPRVPLHRQKAKEYRGADVRDPENCFYLRMSDDAMVGAGLRRGDLVLLRRQSEARSGQLVLCTIDGMGGVLRRCHRQGDWTIVQAESPGAVPRLFSAAELDSGRLELLGVALELVRVLDQHE